MAHVLVVEDEKSIRITIREFLVEDGHEVQIAEDAIEAKTLLKTEDFDLVVTDIIMPRISGMELLKTIREISPHVQVILITGEPTVETASEAVRAGAFDYIAKPVTKDTITRIVTNAAKVKFIDDERRHLQEENRKYQGHLKKLVEERTKKLKQEITERKKIEKALRASEFSLMEAQRLAKIGNWEFDFSNEEFKYSDELSSIFELKPQKFGVTYKAFLEVVHPDDRDYVNKFYTESVKNKVPYDNIHRLLLKDGIIKYVHEHCEITYDKNGKPISSVGTVQDVTERKIAEQKLLESERYYRSLLNQLHEDVMVVDSNYKITDLNINPNRLDGNGRKNAIGKNCYEVFHGYTGPCDKEGEFCALKDVFETGKPVSSIHRGVHKNGSIKCVDILFSPFTDNQGKITRVIHSTRDISEVAEAHDELRKLSAATEQSPASIVITDLQGNIEYVNPKFTQITGYNLEESVGQNPRILKSGEHNTDYYKELWDTIASGKIWRGELHNMKKNGQLFWEDVTIGPITDESGRISHFIAIKEDKTRQKQLEAQLAQSQKLEAVGQLAGGVAHDFNNILTVINGYTSLVMQNMGEDDPLINDLHQIKNAGERAETLTQQLLAFSRKQVIKPDILDLNLIISNTEKMLRRLITENIEFKKVLDPELGYVKTDSGQIDQILMNLTVNARDAMLEGGKLIIETANVHFDNQYGENHMNAKSGSYVMISVSDNGTGMDKNTQSRIFEPFFTTKDYGKGTGLGLSTVYGIVKQNKGYIWVYSEPGVGTTFKVYLPKISEKLDIVKSKKIDLTELSGTETVLVVEDDLAVRRVTTNFLSACGYKILEANNGNEALKLLRKHKWSIDLLLTDLIMPELGGHELVKQIKTKIPNLIVVYCSGYTEDTITQQGILIEDVPLLSKPFTQEALLKIVRKTLDENKTINQ